jgi:hypothetical protein
MISHNILNFDIEEDEYRKHLEREEVMKKLLTSQETYIKELEGKSFKLEDELKAAQMNAPQDLNQSKPKSTHGESEGNQNDQVSCYFQTQLCNSRSDRLNTGFVNAR